MFHKLLKFNNVKFILQIVSLSILWNITFYILVINLRTLDTMYKNIDLKL